MRAALTFAAWIAVVAFVLVMDYYSPSNDDYDGVIGCGTLIPDRVWVSGAANRGAWKLRGGMALPASYRPHDARECARMNLRDRDGDDCILSDIDTPFEIYKPRVSDTLVVVKDGREFAFEIPNHICQRQGSASPRVTVRAGQATYHPDDEAYIYVYNGSPDSLDASLCGAVFERADRQTWSHHSTVRCGPSISREGAEARMAPGDEAELFWHPTSPMSVLTPGTYRLRVRLSTSDGARLPDSTRTSEPFDILVAGDVYE